MFSNQRAKHDLTVYYRFLLAVGVQSAVRVAARETNTRPAWPGVQGQRRP